MGTHPSFPLFSLLTQQLDEATIPSCMILHGHLALPQSCLHCSTLTCGKTTLPAGSPCISHHLPVWVCVLAQKKKKKSYFYERLLSVLLIILFFYMDHSISLDSSPSGNPSNLKFKCSAASNGTLVLLIFGSELNYFGSTL